MNARHEAAFKMRADMADLKAEQERADQAKKDNAAEEKETQHKFFEKLEQSQDLEDNL